MSGNTHLRRWLWNALLLTLVSFPATAAANGGFFTATASAGEATAQRAVIVVGEQGFDLHLQTSFSDGSEDLGWVVPVPAVPQVEASTEALFSELDLLTAPFFALQCSCCCESTGFCPAGGLESFDVGVTVFASGTVGEVEYAVVGASGSATLQDWLSEQGFLLPPSAEPLLDDYIDEGFVFFAARLAPETNGEGAAPTFKLTFPAGTEPVFPMRLTALSAAEPVPVLLHLVGAHPFVPSTYPWVQAPRSLPKAGYDNAVAELESGEGGRTFVIEQAGLLHDPAGADTWHYEWRQEIRDLLPTSFDPLVQRFLDDDPIVTRMRATLSAEAMTEDVRFVPEELSVSQYHQTSASGTECCPECPPMTHDGGVDSGADGADGGVRRLSASGGCVAASRPSGGEAWLLALAVAALVLRRARASQ